MNTIETAGSGIGSAGNAPPIPRAETLNVAVHAALLTLSAGGAVTIGAVGSSWLFPVEAWRWWSQLPLLGFTLSGLLGILIAMTGFRSLAGAAEIDRVHRTGDAAKAEVLRIIDASNCQMIRGLLVFQFGLFLLAALAAGMLIAHAVISGAIPPR